MYLAAQPDRLCNAREIAEHYGISRNHLVKVLHRLSQLGYITSSKGKGGGIKLAQNAHKLKIGDLVQQLEPNMHLAECFDRDTNTCRIIDFCQMRHFLADGNKAFIAALNKHTLADAARNTSLFLTKPATRREAIKSK